MQTSGNFHYGTTEGLTYLYFPRLAATGLLRHVFSTRRGGVSNGFYSSLNLGLHVGDDRACVIENRRRFCRVLGAELSDLVAARQEHTDNVAVITAADRGRGAGDETTALPATDALITAAPGVALSVYTADCVPVLLFDPKCRVVGLIHAGWRGTVAGIAEQTLARMTAVFGTEPRDCLAGIGPSIGPCCYLVDEPVIRLLRDRCPDWAEFARPAGPGQWQLDLWEANRRQLAAGGLRPGNIAVSGLCTACRTDLFFSHRAEQGRTGRQAAGVVLL